MQKIVPLWYLSENIEDSLQLAAGNLRP